VFCKEPLEMSLDFRFFAFFGCDSFKESLDSGALECFSSVFALFLRFQRCYCGTQTGSADEQAPES
jgi:hypothetical protein